MNELLKKLQTRLGLAMMVLRTGQVPTTRRANIPAILPEEVSEIKLFFPLNKFFIFGHARSGTTLLTRLVRLHPKVHCNYQAHFFTRAPLLEGLVENERVRQWLARSSNRWNSGRDLSPMVLRAVSDFIMERDARRVGKHIPGYWVGDKSPNSLLDGDAVHLLHKVYPDARLIFIVRDGRDAVISHRFQSFIDMPQTLSREDARIRAEFSQNPEPFLTGKRSLFTESGLRKSAIGWVKNIEETDAVAHQLLGLNYHHLRYEDLLTAPWDEMCKLWGFLDLESETEGLQQALDKELGRNPDAEWQRTKTPEIIKYFPKGEPGYWRSLFTQQDREIFKEIAGETLISWEYETDTNW